MFANIDLSLVKRGVLGLMLALVGLLAGAMPAQAMNRGSKMLLIINSYHEDELWTNKMSQPIETYLAHNDSVRCEKEFLNNSSVPDMETYQKVCDNLFSKYAQKHPDYVVLMGNFAFTLRDRIKEEWGDVPFVLISRIDTYSPLESYFANADNESNYDISEQLPLGQLRNKYNFSAVIVPDFEEETLDLMMDLIPDMKELVFMSDRAFVNKVVAMKIRSALLEVYPDVAFRWIQASQESSLEMIDMLIDPHPATGLLLASWVYEVTNARGFNVLTTKDLTFLSSAVNPVFTLRLPYMQMGSVGGVFPNGDDTADKIEEMARDMIRGIDMRQVPFYVPHKGEVTVNYERMQRYDLKLSRLPQGAIIINKPESYLEKYWPVVFITILALCIVIFVFVLRNRMQRRQIAVLQRHHNFINKMPMPYTKATLWLDKDDNVININYDVKNLAYEELIQRNALPDNPLHLFSNSYLSDIAKQLLSTGEPVSVRHHFKRTDIYCYFIFVPLDKVVIEKKKRSLAEALVAAKLDIDVFSVDITKDHQMQQQLKDQAVTIDISMEMAQLIPWQWDIESDTISFYNYRANDGSGATTTSDGKPVSTLKFDEFIKMMPNSDAEEAIRLYHRIIRGDASRIDHQFRLYRADHEGDYDWCENHGVVTDTDSDGRPLRITGSLQFVTDRKQQEEKMQEALTKAKESDMLKSAFLANMSHEIRTPLNAIVGFSNLLTSTDSLEERKEFADIINRNNELLLSLINDILDLAKIESNTITLTYDLCDMHDVVDSISKTVSIRVPKGVKLNVVHYADSCVVKADAAHVSQILINLLTNATKFTKRGSITVGYEVYEDENQLYFYVKDTGIGIKKENIDKVFNRFVKLNNFVQGSGLGLAICRTLVEKMGGEIGVESAGEGRGCKFWFTIPYDPAELKIDDTEVVREALPEHIMGERSDKPAKVENASFEFQTPGDISHSVMESVPSGLTVLVAEDNPSNYWLMERLMKDKFKLHHAENGRLAVEMEAELHPDLIIMDINMPELDGYGAVEAMRKRGVTAPIIAVTAYAFASDRVRILNSGFNAFVSKPVSASILYDTIAEVWERKKMRDAAEKAKKAEEEDID